jgi:hypothetical protein
MSTYSPAEGTRYRDVTAPATRWRTGTEGSGIKMPDAGGMKAAGVWEEARHVMGSGRSGQADTCRTSLNRNLERF